MEHVATWVVVGPTCTRAKELAAVQGVLETRKMQMDESGARSDCRLTNQVCAQRLPMVISDLRSSEKARNQRPADVCQTSVVRIDAAWQKAPISERALAWLRRYFFQLRRLDRQADWQLKLPPTRSDPRYRVAAQRKPQTVLPRCRITPAS